ncbi:putative integral membrane protein [Babesia bovis T2Bo]|uniref:putative integral membrane protein n=1 Tax=Babesia bovis T2Bo TaxID=484906 RepID=UPI001C359283|nr:putative integral membrane protein [Babesia bovis T2Bo]KAG6440049.1 putative integral membrane protein [Babesia bovis T2Bo]
MYLFSALVGWFALFVGSSFGITDLRLRQQCIEKCLVNHKAKFMRPMHRLMCKISCNRRHGQAFDTAEHALHPAFNGLDGLMRG